MPEHLLLNGRNQYHPPHPDLANNHALARHAMPTSSLLDTLDEHPATFVPPTCISSFDSTFSDHVAFVPTNDTNDLRQWHDANLQTNQTDVSLAQHAFSDPTQAASYLTAATQTYDPQPSQHSCPFIPFTPQMQQDQAYFSQPLNHQVWTPQHAQNPSMGWFNAPSGYTDGSWNDSMPVNTRSAQYHGVVGSQDNLNTNYNHLYDQRSWPPVYNQHPSQTFTSTRAINLEQHHGWHSYNAVVDSHPINNHQQQAFFVPSQPLTQTRTGVTEFASDLYFPIHCESGLSNQFAYTLPIEMQQAMLMMQTQNQTQQQPHSEDINSLVNLSFDMGPGNITQTPSSETSPTSHRPRQGSRKGTNHGKIKKRSLPRRRKTEYNNPLCFNADMETNSPQKEAALQEKLRLQSLAKSSQDPADLPDLPESSQKPPNLFY